MRIFRYGKRELDHLKKRDEALGAAIDRIGMLEPNFDSQKSELHVKESMQ
ncbi:hypothetical protein Mpsy_1314 [Methanolobus psychrophilus R15]|nr:hypothetical protein Mpsy_1314 [Methanolobus psychrophilus R15]